MFTCNLLVRMSLLWRFEFLAVYFVYCSHLMFLSGPESMEVEKWEEDEEVAMDIDMDDAMVIEMFDNVSSMD